MSWIHRGFGRIVKWLHVVNKIVLLSNSYSSNNTQNENKYARIHVFLQSVICTVS